jgi:DNA-binding NtrC family response regulator
MATYRRSLRRGPNRFSPEALDQLVHYHWPGNVRELKNLVERLVVTVENDTIRVEHLPEIIRQIRPREEEARVPRTNEELKAMKRQAHDHLWRELERSFVIEALRRCDWNVTRAARETGLLRPNFHALMRKYGIRAGDA